MAKDGTNRGGARPGAGRKPKALKEKLDTGNPGKRPLTKLDIPENIEGVDMPKPGEYLSGLQRDGKPLGADEIYNKVCRWLTKLGCEKLVNPTLVEQYAMQLTVKSHITGRKKKLDAFVYIMHEERELGIPSSVYVRTCIAGYRHFGFDLKHLRLAMDISERGEIE